MSINDIPFLEENSKSQIPTGAEQDNPLLILSPLEAPASRFDYILTGTFGIPLWISTGNMVFV